MHHLPTALACWPACTRPTHSTNTGTQTDCSKSIGTQNGWYHRPEGRPHSQPYAREALKVEADDLRAAQAAGRAADCCSMKFCDFPVQGCMTGRWLLFQICCTGVQAAGRAADGQLEHERRVHRRPHGGGQRDDDARAAHQGRHQPRARLPPLPPGLPGPLLLRHPVPLPRCARSPAGVGVAAWATAPATCITTASAAPALPCQHPGAFLSSQATQRAMGVGQSQSKLGRVSACPWYSACAVA